MSVHTVQVFLARDARWTLEVDDPMQVHQYFASRAAAVAAGLKTAIAAHVALLVHGAHDEPDEILLKERDGEQSPRRRRKHHIDCHRTDSSANRGQSQLCGGRKVRPGLLEIAVSVDDLGGCGMLAALIIQRGKP